MRLVLHPEARQELRAAAIWYDDQREGLGDEFVQERTVILAFAHAKRRPLYWLSRLEASDA